MFCGNGPSGKPERSVAEACPAALPETGRPSAAHWVEREEGREEARCCAIRGASMNWTARPTSRCHSMWPVVVT